MNGAEGQGGELSRVLRNLRNEAPAAAAAAGAQQLSLDQLQSVMSNLGMPPGAAAPGAVSSDALARALQAMTPLQGLSLTDVANGDDVTAAAIFDDDDTVARLLEHLPEDQRTRSELHGIIRAPQFRQALGQLTRALQTPENYESIVANFGLRKPAPQSVESHTYFPQRRASRLPTAARARRQGAAPAATRDPVERFLNAIVGLAAAAAAPAPAPAANADAMDTAQDDAAPAP
ncbi:hypothetical protein M885DRAFT_223198 [Pelagophyceae sp. CCMP2097]|nr:hypothetical protein M885DRAFT_223198 [Pelagophyceae sp. CCMP2097]